METEPTALCVVPIKIYVGDSLQLHRHTIKMVGDSVSDC